jgi:ABC-type dipeptide/oligopeptide/nickel transport system permease subunit
MSSITPSILLTPDPASSGEEISRSLWSDAWTRLRRRPSTLICLSILAIYLLIGLASFIPALKNKAESPVGDDYIPPTLTSFNKLLGTDIQGRPVIWRLLYGTRVALLITIFSSILALGIGVTLGVIAGYFGRWIDDIIVWLYTTFSSIPWVLLMIAFVYALKSFEIDPILMIILALGLTDWVGICRLMRAEVMKHRDRDYVHAARAAGVGTPRILLRHILPNVFHLIIITFSLNAVTYVQAEVVLTFLGLGITAEPSWGRMIDDAKLELLRGVWWQAVAATVAIGILCLALNILGDALRDALDPKLRGAD